MARPTDAPSQKRKRISLPAVAAPDMASAREIRPAVDDAGVGTPHTRVDAGSHASISPSFVVTIADSDQDIYPQAMTEPPVPELDNDMSTTSTEDLASSVYHVSPSSASLARGDYLDPALVPAEEHAYRQDDAVSMYHGFLETRPMVLSSVEDESGSEAYIDEDGESTILSTRSVNPLDLPYVTENDRTYCGDYYMPVDEMELDRLYLFHQVYLKILDSQLTIATLEEPKHILDIGAASGDWAMAIAEKFPDCEVTGVDIADVFERRAPINCFWEVDDAEIEWERPTNRYDLIHLRNMDGAFRDWAFIYESAYRCLKPGGWIEIMDFVDHQNSGGALAHFKPTSQIHRFMASVDKAAELAGRPRGTEHLEPRMLFDAGYVDVHVEDHCIPFKLNDGAIGKAWLVAQLATLEAMGLRLLTKYMGWTAEEVRAAAAAVEKELLDFARAPGRPSAALKTRTLLGRKPKSSARWPTDLTREAGRQSQDGTETSTTRLSDRTGSNVGASQAHSSVANIVNDEQR
ncbi:S-adenosyl-L-methionine-dependent methyltransferase [Microdochium trichocladiopsis]|uniref:S-adenosyl-L-methionine-dependent methyltransferase n=1 Tax=Microdochium trichocladiopsis TaxID=1682393 RepID=A0A9P9BV51_9PEZI|nr:S-adenosyl-L-methionine-dependent methyltransferase [Microdochium trichocladiopsis]KAH7038129.1 S-adenosyl-L-methionine-dependent methyltransferase [Microdochium trichocladiopsis]